MKPRIAERYRVQSRLFFSSVDASIEGEGTIADLSKSGCSVKSETQPPEGSELRLSLFLSDYSWPMKIDRAVVRWSKRLTFGVEFLDLQPAQRDRLVRTIMKLRQDAGH